MCSGENRNKVQTHERTLRLLSVPDEAFVATILAQDASSSLAAGLDARNHAFVRLGALIAVDAPPAAYHASVAAAVGAGVSLDEIVGALVALLPTVGVARVASAAPKLGLAVGYDVDAGLEEHDQASMTAG